MQQSFEESIIPNYALEPDATGNLMFRINKNDSVVNYKRSDFLIPHRKDYFFMAFVKKGASRHWIDMTPYDLKPDTFYFTVPQQVHLKESAQPLTGVSISFNSDFLASDNNGSLKDLPIIQNPYNGHELLLSKSDVIFIEDLLEKIYSEHHSENSWQHTMLLSYMKILLVYLSRLYSEQFSEKDMQPGKLMLKNYLAKINEFYNSRHEVALYADMLNISAGHLSEVVKAQSGKPAIAHIHERLLLEAKRFLFHSDYAIKEIAYQLGFEDASYFNRFFKRLTNYTPVNYRNNFREMYH